MPPFALLLFLLFPLLPLLFLLVAPHSLLDFFPLLFDQELLHGIVLVVIPDEQRKLPLLWEHGPLFLLVVFLVVLLGIFGTFARRFALALRHGRPVDFALVRVLVVAELVTRVVDADEPVADGGAAEVVDGQVGAALVFVLEPAEALGFAGLFVARQLEPDGLAELREDGDDIAFG